MNIPGKVSFVAVFVGNKKCNIYAWCYRSDDVTVLMLSSVGVIVDPHGECSDAFQFW